MFLIHIKELRQSLSIGPFFKYIKKKLYIKSFDSENTSKCKFQPFHRGKVKIKKEIVPMELSLSSKIKKKNNYIEPNKWNKIKIH